MKQLATLMQAPLDSARPNGQKPPSCVPPTPSAMALMQDSKGRQELTNLVFQCFQGLKTYGKEPEQLESVNGMFQLVLADYPIEKIRQAFAFYLRRNSEMPAPADIAQIIDRGNKPPFEKAVYVSISRKSAEHRTSEEWAYMRDYEAFIVSGKS